MERACGEQRSCRVNVMLLEPAAMRCPELEPDSAELIRILQAINAVSPARSILARNFDYEH